jgi:hypothetical protein
VTSTRDFSSITGYIRTWIPRCPIDASLAC